MRNEKSQCIIRTTIFFVEGFDNHHINISIAKTVIDGCTYAWTNEHCNQKNLVRPGYVFTSVLAFLWEEFMFIVLIRRGF